MKLKRESEKNQIEKNVTDILTAVLLSRSGAAPTFEGLEAKIKRWMVEVLTAADVVVVTGVFAAST